MLSEPSSGIITHVSFALPLVAYGVAPYGQCNIYNIDYSSLLTEN